MRELEGGEFISGESYAFAKKRAEADGLEYPVDGAEQRDLKHIIENSCISCNKLLPKYTVKVVPSRYIQEKDRYVRSGFVNQRVMCVACYNSIKSRTRLLMHTVLRRKPKPSISSFVDMYIIKH